MVRYKGSPKLESLSDNIVVAPYSVTWIVQEEESENLLLGNQPRAGGLDWAVVLCDPDLKPTFSSPLRRALA